MKRDYNIVYSLVLAGGQKVFLKVHPTHSPDDVKKASEIALQEMHFVDYIAKETGLASAYEKPGVVTTDKMTLSLVRENKGTLAGAMPPQ